MDRWSGRTAVVTGASVGIGAAVARALADAGLVVVAGARRIQLIEELQKKVKGRGRIIPVECDVGKEEELIRLIEVAKNNGGVDVLINNAAQLINGTISGCNGSGAELNDLEECLNINIMAVIRGTRLAVADMVQRGVPGVIIMLNSIVGHKIPVGRMPNTSAYAPTKYMMTALSETIRLEFSHARVPIRITSLSPGAVDTKMLQDAISNIPSEIRAEIPMLKSEDIAEAVLYVLSAPDHVNISEMTIQVIGEKAF